MATSRIELFEPAGRASSLNGCRCFERLTQTPPALRSGQQARQQKLWMSAMLSAVPQRAPGHASQHCADSSRPFTRPPRTAARSHLPGHSTKARAFEGTKQGDFLAFDRCSCRQLCVRLAGWPHRLPLAQAVRVAVTPLAPCALRAHACRPPLASLRRGAPWHVPPVAGRRQGHH
jgi:hypothetical protein